MIRLWKGYHSRELYSWIERAWNHGETLILSPPHLADLSFVSSLPEGELELVGDWPTETRETISELGRSRGPAPNYPETPVLGVFTSATVSGNPRLVLYSRNNIQSSLKAISGFFDRNAFDTIFCYPQAFHTFGLTLGYVLSLIHDLRLITVPGKYSSASHEARVALRKEHVLTLGTPTHFMDLLHYCHARGVKPVASYSNIMGGAIVSVPLWRRVRDELGIQAPSIGYGCTEASPGLTHSVPGQEPLEDGEIGRILESVSLNLVPGQGVEFSGPSACTAIIHGGSVEFPERILIRDEIHQRADGVCVFRGRYDLTLNRGGEKFSLERIETTLRNHLDRDVMCVAVPHQRLGHELGVLVPATPARPDLGEVSAVLEKSFHTRFAPENLVCVEELPVNASSKPDRKTGVSLLLQQQGTP